MGSTYSEEASRAKLAHTNLQAWEWQSGQLYRRYQTANWRVTLLTANAIGFLAEAAYHHPQLVLNYRSIEVYLTTHDAGGITDKDFALAWQIEETLRWPGGKADVLDGPPTDWLRD